MKGSQCFWEDESGRFAEMGLHRKGIREVEKGEVVDRKLIWKATRP